MSVATEFAPTVYIPSHLVPSPSAPGAPRGGAAPAPRPAGGAPGRLATVTTLHRPAPRSVAPAVHLTRRGVAVLGAAVALTCVALVWLAWASAPSVSRASGAAHSGGSAATVTVRSGDTLWSIATRVAPGRDPRAEVATLQRLNHLDGVDLAAGQVLRTR